MHLSTLSDWLAWIASVHTAEIELGLDRVKQVAERLQVLHPACPVIIVGGTNGKGSTVAGLEAIYRAMGYQVGAFTSPIVFKHNEQVRINGVLASDEAFCQAFATVEAARGEITLTPFEYCTLAALLIFKTQPLDVLLLEVGLGGRLDATNIIDADAAVVTSIGIDHTEWLGGTRELIAREKAGIFRSGRVAVCGDANPPVTLLAYAKEINTPLFCVGKAFNVEDEGNTWRWMSAAVTYAGLPKNSLALQNMATVLMVITVMQSRLPVARAAIDTGLASVQLFGRIQIEPGPVREIFDVAHNPDSVHMLVQALRKLAGTGKTLAVFSMLADKDIHESVNIIKDQITHWYVAPLNHTRAASQQQLANAFKGEQSVLMYPTIEQAYAAAKAEAVAGDQIVIFGSFHTVAAVWKVRCS